MAWYSEYVLKPEAAGVAGAFLGFLHAPGATWRERLFNLTAGVGASVYLAPWISKAAFGFDSPEKVAGIAFVTGLVGMNLLAKIIEQAKALPPLDFGIFTGFFKKNNTSSEKPKDHQ